MDDAQIAVVGGVVALVAIVLLLLMFRRRSPAPAPAVGLVPAERKLPSLIPPSVDSEEADATVMARIPSLARAEDEEEASSPSGELSVDLEAEPEDEDLSDASGAYALILVTATARTDRGLHRSNNEDSVLTLPEENLYVVADGMGGYAGGEVASKLAVDTMEHAFRTRSFPGLKRRTPYRRANELVRAIELANDAILAGALANPENADMGTTVVAARFSPSKRRVYVAYVGDSRAYRLRDGKLEQLTVDHTLESEAGVKGRLGMQLSRAVGVKPHVKTDVRVEEARPGDHYLICSDGLSKMVPDDAVRECIVGVGLEPAAKRLVAAANERGGKDNISVVLIRIDEARPTGV